jgi:hypothetical protein
MDMVEDSKRMAVEYRRLMKEAYAKGFHPSYGSAKMFEKYGHRVPDKKCAKGAVFGSDPSWEDRHKYAKHLVKQVDTKGGPLDKAEEYYKIEFGETPDEAGFAIEKGGGGLKLEIPGLEVVTVKGVVCICGEEVTFSRGDVVYRCECGELYMPKCEGAIDLPVVLRESTWERYDGEIIE